MPGLPQQVFPAVIVVEQDMNVSDLVLLASRLDGSSVRLSIPVILSGPPYPTQLGLPAPASVTLM